MKPNKPYKLRLTKMAWLSSVDFPAQGEGARALLVKRKGQPDDIEFVAPVAKLDEELGLVFGHAFSASLDGGSTPHVDYQDDAIDPDFVKVAMAFMEDGGPTDVNHDCAPDGKVVFAWPLVPDVNEALGIKSDVIGLAVAVKPSAETFAKFKSGELTGFSLYGSGVRAPLDKSVKAPVLVKAGPERVKKASLYTDEVDGHQHTITIYEDGCCSTSWATSAGADSGHSHSVVFENGALTILADSGHTHELAEGQPGIVAVPADAIVVIAASASKSTRSDRVQQDEPTTEEPMTTPADKQTFDLTKQLETANGKVTDLTAKLELQTKLASLSDAQRSYYKSLGAGDAEDFLAKSYADRELDVAVEYQAKDGTVYRKHEDRRLIEMAKRQDQMTADLAKRDEEIEKAEIAEIAKSVLGSVAGKSEVHAYIVKSIKKGGGNAAMIDEALTALKGANAAAKSASFAKGYNPGTEPVANSAEAALEAIAQKIATEQKVDIHKARDLALDTPEGAVAYQEMRKRKAMNQASA